MWCLCGRGKEVSPEPGDFEAMLKGVLQKRSEYFITFHAPPGIPSKGHENAHAQGDFKYL